MALRQKRGAAEPQKRPVKRLRRESPPETAERSEATTTLAPAEAQVQAVPIEEVALELALVETEEGKVRPATPSAVVVIDGEDEGVPPAADVTEAGQMTGVGGLAPPADEVGQSVGAGGELPSAGHLGEEAAPTSVGQRTGHAASCSKRRGARGGRDVVKSSSRRPERRRVSKPSEEAPGGTVRLAPQFASMQDAITACALLSRARTTETNAEMGKLSQADVLDSIMVNVLQLAHGAFAVRSAAVENYEKLTAARERIGRYKEQSRSQNEKLQRLEGELKAQEERLTGLVRESESHAEIERTRTTAAEARLALVSARQEAASKRIEDLTLRLRHAEDRTESAMDEIRGAMARATAAETAATKALREKAAAAAHAHEADVRAEKAVHHAQEAEARVREVEAKLEEAEGRVHQAHAEAEEAKARAEAAVAEFKASEEFEREVIEGSLESFARGFDLCKEKVATTFNISRSDLERIQADDLGGEAGVDGEETVEEAGAEEP